MIVLPDGLGQQAVRLFTEGQGVARAIPHVGDLDRADEVEDSEALLGGRIVGRILLNWDYSRTAPCSAA